MTNDDTGLPVDDDVSRETEVHDQIARLAALEVRLRASLEAPIVSDSAGSTTAHKAPRWRRRRRG